jgi:hypothetical protein
MVEKKIRISWMTILAVIITFIFCSCSTSITVSSYSDGPYVFYTDNRAGVITFDSLLNPDTTYFSQKELESLTLRSEFDSISCPALEFQIKDKIAGSEAENVLPAKLIAISDIEGNFEKFYKLLKANNVIDKNYNWSFGEGHLVIVGDLVDRGDYVTQCLWLIYRLEEEAIRAGGKVQYLLGNHDRMIMSGDDRYVSEKYHPLFDRLKVKASDLYSDSTEFGRWMRTKNAVAQAGKIIFVHGGLSHELLEKDLTIADINSAVQKEIDKADPEYDEAKFLFSKYGILWYRGLIQDYGEYKKIPEDKLEEVLKKYSAETVVIGHCVMDSVSSDFSGKVIRIDVDHYEKAQGLLIDNGIFYAVDENGNRRRLK